MIPPLYVLPLGSLFYANPLDRGELQRTSDLCSPRIHQLEIARLVGYHLREQDFHTAQQPEMASIQASLSSNSCQILSFPVAACPFSGADARFSSGRESCAPSFPDSPLTKTYTFLSGPVDGIFGFFLHFLISENPVIFAQIPLTGSLSSAILTVGRKTGPPDKNVYIFVRSLFCPSHLRALQHRLSAAVPPAGTKSPARSRYTAPKVSNPGRFIADRYRKTPALRFTLVLFSVVSRPKKCYK